MSKKEFKTKELIKEYLLSEGMLRENLPDSESKLEFGFVFSFPPGQESQKMSVFKPKNKDFIIILLGTQLSNAHINDLKSSKENVISHFFMELRKIFIAKEVFFRIDIENYRFEINDRIFLKNNGYLSKNSFFKIVKKLFYCLIYANLLLEQIFTGDVNFSKKTLSGFDFSFYS